MSKAKQLDYTYVHVNMLWHGLLCFHEREHALLNSVCSVVGTSLKSSFSDANIVNFLVDLVSLLSREKWVCYRSFRTVVLVPLRVLEGTIRASSDI